MNALNAANTQGKIVIISPSFKDITKLDSNLKITLFVLVVIIALSSIAAGIIGILNYVGVFSTLSQVNSIILMATGGLGLLLLITEIVFAIRFFFKNNQEDHQANDALVKSKLKLNKLKNEEEAQTAAAEKAKLDALKAEKTKQEAAENAKKEKEAQTAAAEKAKLDALKTEKTKQEAAENAKKEKEAADAKSLEEAKLALPADLTPFFTKEFDKKHILQQPFPIEEFLNDNTPSSKNYFKDMIKNHNLDAIDVLKGRKHSFDSTLLDMPLVFWINRKNLKSEDIKEKTYLNAVSSSDQHRIQLIDDRIEALDRVFQLRTRLEELNNSTCNIHVLTVKDALYAWSHDKAIEFRLSCLKDEEICTLTCKSLKYLGHDNVFSSLFSRLIKIDPKRPPILPQQFTEMSILNIPLVDLAKLPIQNINPSLHKYIPPLAFGLFPSDQLKKINTTVLDTSHWECISQLSVKSGKIKSRPLVRYFEPEQINVCIENINYPELLQQLSIKQISNIDIKRMDENIFKSIFPINTIFPTLLLKKRLPKLSLEKIYEFYPFFDAHHWKSIGKKHILALDFDKLTHYTETAKKQAFAILFTTDLFTSDLDSSGAQLIENFTIDQIYKLHSYFDINHWKFIGEKNALKLDFNKLSSCSQELKKEIFNTIFPISILETLSWRNARLLAKMNINQIYGFLNENLMYLEHWAFIGEKNVLELDFNKFSEASLKMIVPEFFNSSIFKSAPYQLCINRLKPEQYEIIKPYLTTQSGANPFAIH